MPEKPGAAERPCCAPAQSIFYLVVGMKDIRWIQRLDSLRKAFGQLENAVELSRRRGLTELEKQGMIQAFEFTHELAWKTLKDFLESRGNEGIFGSRDAFREAFAYGLIEDGEVWMETIRSRNESSHTYNEKTADGIIEAVQDRYYSAFSALISRLTEIKNDDAER